MSDGSKSGRATIFFVAVRHPTQPGEDSLESTRI